MPAAPSPTPEDQKLSHLLLIPGSLAMVIIMLGYVKLHVHCTVRYCTVLYCTQDRLTYGIRCSRAAVQMHHAMRTTMEEPRLLAHASDLVTLLLVCQYPLDHAHASRWITILTWASRHATCAGLPCGTSPGHRWPSQWCAAQSAVSCTWHRSHCTLRGPATAVPAPPTR